MHPPEHVLKAIEQINPNARIGWTQRDYAGSPPGGGFAILDLYPARGAEKSFSAPWDDSGPVYGSRYDPLMRVPIIAGWVLPQQVFNGDVIAMVENASALDEEHRRRVREKNENAIKERVYDRKQLAGEMGEELYHNAQKSTESVPTIPEQFITAEERAKLDGSWEEKAPNEAPIEMSGIGLT